MPGWEGFSVPVQAKIKRLQIPIKAPNPGSFNTVFEKNENTGN